MRFTKCLPVFVQLILTTQLAYGQTVTPRLLEFKEPKRDIGVIKKEGGAVELRFEYRNIADKPVVIRDIHSQCGMCLNGKFDTEPLNPGQSDTVLVTFDPETKYGDFKISLTVIATNGDYNKYSTLTVSGTVESDITIEDEKYKYVYSDEIRSDQRAVGMRLIEDKRKEVTRSLEMYNRSDREVVMTFSHDSKYLRVQSPVTISPGEAAKIEFMLDPRRLPEGEFMIPVQPNVDGVKTEQIIEVRGTVKAR